MARVVRLLAPHELVFEDELLASASPGELVCETIVTALSPGTELAAYVGKPPLRPSVVYPRVQGYCNVARVVESNADGYRMGDRVLSFTSHRDRFVLSASDVLYRLGGNDVAGEIACAYLYHLGYNAVLRSGTRPGSKVLVVGLGALGLTSCAMAAVAGADVYALSDHAQPAALAMQMGATAVFARSDDALMAEALGSGADVVIFTTDAWTDWEIALRVSAQNGTIAVLGFPGRDKAPGQFNPLASQWFYMKQLRIEAVGWSPEQDDSRNFLRFNERANIAWLARLIGQHRIDPRLIISGVYPAGEIAQAYANLLARVNSPVTYLLKWNS